MNAFVVHVVRNKTGPLSTDSSVAELKAALMGPSVHQHRERKPNDHNFWSLEERLSNMEEYLQIHNKSKTTVLKNYLLKLFIIEGPMMGDVHSRIQHLEKQLVELESFSPEYVQCMVGTKYKNT